MLNRRAVEVTEFPGWIYDAGQPLQQIRLRFAPTAAKYIREKIWHASEQSKLLPDGSVELSMSLRSLIEIRRWILSWGAECEVLEPEELRSDILREATEIVSRSDIPEPAAKTRSRKPRKKGADSPS